MWELLGHLAGGAKDAVIATRMRIRLSTCQNYISEIYSILEIDDEEVNARVSAARWYWTRKAAPEKRYIIEVAALPITVEIRQKPGGNYIGRSEYGRI